MNPQDSTPNQPTDEPQTAPPVMHEAVPQSQGPRMSLSGKGIKLVAGLAILLLVIALGYFVWYKPNQPDAVLAKAFMHTMELESVGVSANATISTDDKNDKAPMATLTASGGFSTKGSFQLNGDLLLDKSKADQKVTFELRSPDGKDLYAKVSGVDSLETLLSGGITPDPAYSGDNNPFKSLDNKWLVLSKDTQDMLLQNQKVTTGGINLSDDDRKAIKKAYKQHAFVKVAEAKGSEDIDGVKSRHFAVKIDKNELVAFAEQVKNDVKSLKITDDQIKSIRDADFSDKDNFDVWVGDNYITQVKFTDDAKDAAKQQSITVKLNKYNQPVNVEKPADAKPLLEALSSMFLNGSAGTELPDSVL